MSEQTKNVKTINDQIKELLDARKLRIVMASTSINDIITLDATIINVLLAEISRLKGNMNTTETPETKSE
jgi:cysteinyl-tRNA synthetase